MFALLGIPLVIGVSMAIQSIYAFKRYIRQRGAISFKLYDWISTYNICHARLCTILAVMNVVILTYRLSSKQAELVESEHVTPERVMIAAFTLLLFLGLRLIFTCTVDERSTAVPYGNRRAILGRRLLRYRQRKAT
jgi:hypothetical protein